MTSLARTLLIALAFGGWLAPKAFAADAEAGMRQYLQAHILGLTQNPMIVSAIRSQNQRTTEFSVAEIEALDQSWRNEIGQNDRPTITPVLNNPAAAILRNVVAAETGDITEIFVMDAVGLNVAASAVTSDYWQGDEAKFTETFAKGPGVAHFSDVTRDESTGEYQVQISYPIVDPASGAVIGAITVGVDAALFF